MEGRLRGPLRTVARGEVTGGARRRCGAVIGGARDGVGHFVRWPFMISYKDIYGERDTGSPLPWVPKSWLRDMPAQHSERRGGWRQDAGMPAQHSERRGDRRQDVALPSSAPGQKQFQRTALQRRASDTGSHCSADSSSTARRLRRKTSCPDSRGRCSDEEEMEFGVGRRARSADIAEEKASRKRSPVRPSKRSSSLPSRPSGSIPCKVCFEPLEAGQERYKGYMPIHKRCGSDRKAESDWFRDNTEFSEVI